MDEKITLTFRNKSYDFPLVQGTEGELAIDISSLRAKTGLITLDQGFTNTGSCKSPITYLDGEKGILRYRGISIEDLADKATFKETAHLLIRGDLPTAEQLSQFSQLLTHQSMVHESMRLFFRNFPQGAHPMAILSSMVNALRTFYPELDQREEEINITVTRLLSKIRTLAAMSYRISLGKNIVYPEPDLAYCSNFLHMMFDSPVKPYVQNDTVIEALRKFWILHADHEQNCSTATVKIVGSTRANLYASISSGISALWGPLHGGANQSVVEMLTEMTTSGIKPEDIVERAKRKDSGFRLSGFGHRVYKTFDPRAVIMKKMCHRLLSELHIDEPLFDVAMKLEAIALKDDYFIEHNLYPNIDFYSGIVLRAIGIPTDMFTVMFAIGRLPGWIAHWIDEMNDPTHKIYRPRQIYTGCTQRKFVPLKQRVL